MSWRSIVMMTAKSFGTIHCARVIKISPTGFYRLRNQNRIKCQKFRFPFGFWHTHTFVWVEVDNKSMSIWLLEQHHLEVSSLNLYRRIYDAHLSSCELRTAFMGFGHLSNLACDSTKYAKYARKRNRKWVGLGPETDKKKLTKEKMLSMQDCSRNTRHCWESSSTHFKIGRASCRERV